MQCDECAGNGYKMKTDIMNAQQVKESCRACRGTGQKFEEQTTGARVGRVCGELWKFQYLLESDVVSELLVLMTPKIGETGLAQADENGHMKVVGHILRLGMQTKRKHRREGYMKKLMEFATMDPKVVRIEAEWNFATGDGRNFLFDFGFIQEGDSLVWKR